jgi:lysozyme
VKVSIKGLIEIAGHEGLCQTKYRDSVGVWTIAVGATKSEIPDLATWPMDKKLTIQECFDLFQRSIKKYADAVDKAVKRPLQQYEFDALVSWCYNVGPGWLKSASVIKKINAGESGQSLYDALMMFKKPVEIISRRKKEAMLLAFGNYDFGGSNLVNVFPVSAMGKPLYRNGYDIDPLQYLKMENPVPQVSPRNFEATKINPDAKVNLMDKVVDFLKSYGI